MNLPDSHGSPPPPQVAERALGMPAEPTGKPSDRTDRRAFALAAARYVLLGILGWIGVRALRHRAVPDETICLIQRPCATCGVLSTCTRPPAVEHRHQPS